MKGRSIRPHINSPKQSSRLAVAELVGRQADCHQLLRHIRAELKRSNAPGRIDHEDVFQEAIVRGLDPNNRGPDGDVLVWLKRIATNYIIDELRKEKSRTGRIEARGREREVSILMRPKTDDSEVIEAAGAYLNQTERQLLNLCLQDSSPQALARTLRLSTAKSATDAKWRLFKKIRNLSAALQGE